jgi:hypothetical protein
MQTIKRVCVLGTHHAYQYKTVRKKYFENVCALIEIHSVDLVAEEASGIERDTYAKKIADIRKVSWRNVDLTSEERKLVPDINVLGLGTQIDFDLHSLREWVWVIRTAKNMKQSAMLICGFAHLMGVASKFHSLGFAVATEVYFDNEDEKLIVERTEPEPTADKITP